MLEWRCKCIRRLDHNYYILLFQIQTPVGIASAGKSWGDEHQPAANANGVEVRRRRLHAVPSSHVEGQPPKPTCSRACSRPGSRRSSANDTDHSQNTGNWCESIKWERFTQEPRNNQYQSAADFTVFLHGGDEPHAMQRGFLEILEKVCYWDIQHICKSDHGGLGGHQRQPFVLFRFPSYAYLFFYIPSIIWFYFLLAL